MGWQLKVAGERLEELVERALDEGPQEILDEGERVAVVVSAELYDLMLQQSSGTGGDEATVPGDTP